ncbi:hypothetical protein ACFPES_24060 [Paenibacillus sp. GCM10023248]|uniref:hypothetical protein n=1 Tax=unclassified Paenibacillus TaxID=185978 RepID=UPI002379DFE5|nr:hypothetical protein [Paenibacillus sp. MAHUQ-63]MDD9270135.1 hypothetical protein [Paenibacillus sp. MAHUQ-63]
MYNSFNNNYGASNFNSTPNTQTSQYQAQKQFQPSSYVHNQPNPAQSTQSFNQSFNQGMASTESYHTANYRGNQPGHDAYLRSDSTTPSAYQPSSFQNAYSTYNSGRSNQFASTQYQPISYTAMNQQPFSTSQYSSSSAQSFNQQPFGQTAVSPNAYHTANYRGNQPGHDAYLRSDSTTTSQQSFQPSYASQQSAQGMSSYQPQQSFYQQNAQASNQGFGSMGMGMGQQFGYSSSH